MRYSEVRSHLPGLSCPVDRCWPNMLDSLADMQVFPDKKLVEDF